MKHSVRKRIKVTKTGKILKRTMGQNHNLAKKRTAQKKRKKLYREMNFGNKIIKKYH
ncbi:MAG: 50S ribosomal protein L35 [Spirochaetia bacterium]|nr:MAG: 50S ribosomal protein L35 [Spirochaetia bacterium]